MWGMLSAEGIEWDTCLRYMQHLLLKAQLDTIVGKSEYLKTMIVEDIRKAKLLKMPPNEYLQRVVDGSVVGIKNIDIQSEDFIAIRSYGLLSRIEIRASNGAHCFWLDPDFPENQIDAVINVWKCAKRAINEAL
jgi:hypothetical protein